MAGTLGNFFADLHEGVRRGVRPGLLTDGGDATTADETPFDRIAQTGYDPFGNVGGGGYDPFANVGGGGFDPFGSLGGDYYDPFARIHDAPPKQSEAKSGTAIEAGDWSGPATADDNRGLTPEAIDNYIRAKNPNSPLIGKGQAILDAANRYGVSAPLMVGIFGKESSYGTTAGSGYILSGITDPSRDQGLGGQRAFQGFDSWEAAIDATARNLAGPNYKGKSAADQIGMWYVGKTGDLEATDLAGNGTVRQYLENFVGPAYAGLGVPYNPAGAGTRRAGGAVPPSQIAARTQQLAGTVGYTSGGVRVTGNIADGADCSSWAGWLIGADAGDWNAQRLADVSTPIQPGDLQPGDLVFFDIANPGDATARPVGHVAVYLGGGMISQSTTLGGTNGVQVTSLANDPYLSAHIYGYGRYRRRGGTTEGNQ